jgi:hypothetical protein
MMFWVIPEHSRRGTDDGSKRITNCQVLIIGKYAERDGHEGFLDLMQITEYSIKAVENWILTHKAKNPCGVFARYIDSSGFIAPVWNFVSCHGWSLNFEVEEL